MQNKQAYDESAGKTGGELPLHFRLMDIFLQQAEQSASLLTTMVKDMQTVYTGSVRQILNAGELFENRSAVNIRFFRGVKDTFDAISPVITEAQIGVTRTMVDSTCKNIQLMRKSITGQK